MWFIFTYLRTFLNVIITYVFTVIIITIFIQLFNIYFIETFIMIKGHDLWDIIILIFSLIVFLCSYINDNIGGSDLSAVYVLTYFLRTFKGYYYTIAEENTI